VTFPSLFILCLICSFSQFCCCWNVEWMISNSLDLLMQQVWNIIDQNTKSIHYSETWVNIAHGTFISSFYTWTWTIFSATIIDPACKESTALSDSISATAFDWGYTVPLFQFGVWVGSWRFICSGLVHVGDIFYLFSCNVTDVSIKHISLADQMHICIKTSTYVQLSTCSEGKICFDRITYITYILFLI